MPQEKGFAHLLIIIIVLIIVVLGAIFAFGALEDRELAKSCPDPLTLSTPVDLALVTSILYPGQIRGGDFKRHGGFRFDSSKNDEIEVRAPIDSVLVAASRYLEEGEVQYLLDFETNCGIKFRFDHVLTLGPKLAQLAESLPEPKEHDSRTINTDKVELAEGDVIATAVGFEKTENVFVDFGVYEDNSMFQAPNANALCWFDLLTAEDETKVKNFPPADGQSGKTSEYCK